MEELKELFGEGSLDFNAFQTKVAEKGYKLANLASGAYVDKNKYDKLNNDFAKYKTENDVSKYADYDSLKSEIEQLKTEKIENEMMSKVVAKNVNEKFRKFVMSEVKGLVTEQKDFDTCLKEYLETNKQFVEVPKKQAVFQKGNSADDMQGRSQGQETVNKKMNDLLRGARK